MSENAIVKVENNGLTLKEKMALANVFAQSGRFSGDTNAAQAVVKIQAGAELGIPPIQAMTNIHIVQGRVTLGATVIAALIKQSGRYDYKIKKLDETSCELDFYENGEFVGPSSFSMDDAKLAGLTGKDVWKKFPRNMLFSRAISNGARWYAASIFGGAIYTPDELEDESQSVMSGPTPKEVYADFIEWAMKEHGVDETKVKEVLKESGAIGFSPTQVERYKKLVENSLAVDGEVTE